MTKPFVTFSTLALFTGSVLAQIQPPAEAPVKSPLSGPTVDKQDVKPEKTLIERDMSGRVKKLEIPPPEAAAALLELDAAARKKVDEAIAKRNAVLDQIVADNLRLIVELAGARDSGSRDESLRLLGELREKARPLGDLGPLQKHIQAALTDEQRNVFIKLTQDYWNALIAEREADAKEKGEPFKLRDFMRAETLSMIGTSVRQSYERVVGQRAQDFEALLKALNLSDEQESKIRRVVGDSFQKSYGKATPAERGRVVAAVYRELDDDQRRVLVERFAGAPRSGGQKSEPKNEPSAVPKGK